MSEFGKILGRLWLAMTRYDDLINLRLKEIGLTLPFEISEEDELGMLLHSGGHKRLASLPKKLAWIKSVPLTKVPRDRREEDIAGAAKARDFAALEQLYVKYYDSKELTGRGHYLYDIVESAFFAPLVELDDKPQEMEKFLPLYRDWYDAAPTSPFAAAAYGKALGLVGYAYRGYDAARNVTPEQWQQLEKFAHAGRAVFDASADIGRDNYFWNDAFSSFALVECAGQEEAQRRATRCLMLDANNLRFYVKRAVQLMPRWGGTLENLDSFVRVAARRTELAHGQSAYAFIYANLSEYHSNIFTETMADWQLFKPSMYDYLRRYPNNFYANRFALMAYLADDAEAFLDMFNNHMSSVLIDEWGYKRGLLISAYSLAQKKVRRLAAQAANQ